MTLLPFSSPGERWLARKYRDRSWNIAIASCVIILLLIVIAVTGFKRLFGFMGYDGFIGFYTERYGSDVPFGGPIPGIVEWSVLLAPFFGSLAIVRRFLHRQRYSASLTERRTDIFLVLSLSLGISAVVMMAVLAFAMLGFWNTLVDSQARLLHRRILVPTAHWWWFVVLFTTVHAITSGFVACGLRRFNPWRFMLMTAIVVGLVAMASGTAATLIAGAGITPQYANSSVRFEPSYSIAVWGLCATLWACGLWIVSITTAPIWARELASELWDEHRKKNPQHSLYCEQCRYDLRGTVAAQHPICPECGAAIPKSQQDWLTLRLADGLLGSTGKTSAPHSGQPPEVEARKS